jgi:hypothetical protein
MMDIPGYDAWKTMSPDDADQRCEFCGARDVGTGWEPKECTGECCRSWRDADAEYDAMRDEPDAYPSGE